MGASDNINANITLTNELRTQNSELRSLFNIKYEELAI